MKTLEEMFGADAGKRQGEVVPENAKCRDCGITGKELTDPDKWGDWCEWSMCAACCKAWAEDEYSLKYAVTKGTA